MYFFSTKKSENEVFIKGSPFRDMSLLLRRKTQKRKTRKKYFSVEITHRILGKDLEGLNNGCLWMVELLVF